jgi:hypothetical protein
MTVDEAIEEITRASVICTDVDLWRSELETILKAVRSRAVLDAQASMVAAFTCPEHHGRHEIPTDQVGNIQGPVSP